MIIKVKITVIFLLCVYIFSYLLTPIVINKFQINMLNEPTFGTYSSDEISFLKTFYLMRQGQGYYSAFRDARANLSTPDVLTRDTFAWRMPTIFYIWTVMAQNGEQILTVFIFLSIVSLVSIFFLLRKITSYQSALFGSIILLPYFQDTLRYKSAFLFTEWWGLLFFLIGLAAFLYKYKIISVVTFILSITTRELFILPLVALFLLCFFNKKNWKILLSVIILGGLIYMIHTINVQNIMVSYEFKLLNRFHGYHLSDLQKMISFSMKYYVFSGLKTHYLVLLLGVLGLVFNIFRQKSKETLYLLIPILSFLVLPFFSISDNDYWGIMFVPFIIISAALFIVPPQNHECKLVWEGGSDGVGLAEGENKKIPRASARGRFIPRKIFRS